MPGSWQVVSYNTSIITTRNPTYKGVGWGKPSYSHHLQTQACEDTKPSFLALNETGNGDSFLNLIEFGYIPLNHPSAWAADRMRLLEEDTEGDVLPLK